MAVCLHCELEIERVPGSRGRLPKVHPDCRPEYEAEQKKQAHKAQVDALTIEPEWWISYKSKIKELHKTWFPDEEDQQVKE